MAEKRELTAEEKIAELEKALAAEKKRADKAEAKAEEAEAKAEEAETARKEAEANAQRDALKAERSMKAILDAEPKEKIILFKDDSKYVDDVYVAINGVSYQIQRGVEVEVPKSVAEVIHNMEKQDRDAAMKLTAMSSVANARELQ